MKSEVLATRTYWLKTVIRTAMPRDFVSGSLGTRFDWPLGSSTTNRPTEFRPSLHDTKDGDEVHVGWPSQLDADTRRISASSVGAIPPSPPGTHLALSLQLPKGRAVPSPPRDPSHLARSFGQRPSLGLACRLMFSRAEFSGSTTCQPRITRHRDQESEQ